MGLPKGRTNNPNGRPKTVGGGVKAFARLDDVSASALTVIQTALKCSTSDAIRYALVQSAKTIAKRKG